MHHKPILPYCCLLDLKIPRSNRMLHYQMFIFLSFINSFSLREALALQKLLGKIQETATGLKLIR